MQSLSLVQQTILSNVFFNTTQEESIMERERSLKIWRKLKPYYKWKKPLEHGKVFMLLKNMLKCNNETNEKLYYDGLSGTN